MFYIRMVKYLQIIVKQDFSYAECIEILPLRRWSTSVKQINSVFILNLNTKHFDLFLKSATNIDAD